MNLNNPRPTLIIAGQPDWAAEAAARLETAYTVKHIHQRAGYGARLVDEQAALVLADADSAGWTVWVTAVKTSPATRRIPVIVISDTPARRAEALLAGADVALPRAELPALPGIVRDLARVPDPAVLAELACGCAEPLPPLAAAGVAKFNAGEYYPQHDLFEEQWVNTAAPVRDLYRAILQVGVAYYQIERGNYRGALKMLLRSVQWLTLLPDVCQGVDVKRLREDSYRVRAALEQMNPADIAHFDRSLLKPVALVTPPPEDV